MVFAIDSIQVSKVVILRCSFKGKFLFNFEAFVTELVLASSLSLEVFSASWLCQTNWPWPYCL